MANTEEKKPDLSWISISDLQTIVDRLRRIVDGNRAAIRNAQAMRNNPGATEENTVPQAQIDILIESTNKTERDMHLADREINDRLKVIFHRS